MRKMIIEMKNPNTGFWKIAGAVALPLGAIAAFLSLSYNTIHDTFEDTIMSQQTVIENLETRLKQLSREYEVLSEETEGVKQLQLWKSDVIEVGKKSHFRRRLNFFFYQAFR